jgi:2-oxoisovalerate dehydrogenase E1 component alpha subunit
VLIIVTNNRWGISTSYATQQAPARLSDRGAAFQMRCKTIDGNDPISAYLELKEAFEYVRTERKPYLLEAMVSRLRGHSSASGANVVKGEIDCLERFERVIEDRNLMTRAHMEQLRARYTQELADAAKRVRSEPQPAPSSVWDHVFSEKNVVGGEV